MSPENRTTTDFKIKHNTDLFYQETDDLIKNAMKKEQIKNQATTVLAIQTQINKLKFDMEKEEKNAIRRKEKQLELAELEYAKEQILLKNKVAEENAKKEKLDMVERQKETFEEVRTAKKIMKQEDEKRVKENLYDHISEKKLREQIQ